MNELFGEQAEDIINTLWKQIEKIYLIKTQIQTQSPEKEKDLLDDIIKTDAIISEVKSVREDASKKPEVSNSSTTSERKNKTQAFNSAIEGVREERNRVSDYLILGLFS